MPDFQYQPPTGPLSGSEFERQTTRFFQQVQGAADAAQSAASAAQITANEALERAQAPNLVDGKTTQADASGKITVKDVAIGGDVLDLASARGFFYDKYVPWYAGTPADTYLITDFNEFKKPGRYHIRWREGSPASTGEEVTANNPNLGNGVEGWFDAILEIDGLSPASYVTSNARIVQRVIVTNTVNNQNNRIASRLHAGNTWYPWKVTTLNSDFGDGLRITNYKISVPEMEGATASANGVSGLVPPPLKADLGKSLGADGEWTYPADVAVGNDMSDLASARGQLGDAKYITITDFNLFTDSGFFWVKWGDSALNAPPYGVNGFVIVSRPGTLENVCRQLVMRWGVAGTNEWQIFTRELTTTNGIMAWSEWSWLLTSKSLGDGFKFSNGKLSVPEYDGATASSAGISGLVPPAAAGQADYVLCGDGEWRDIKTLVAAAQARLADEKTS